MTGTGKVVSGCTIVRVGRKTKRGKQFKTIREAEQGGPCAACDATRRVLFTYTDHSPAVCNKGCWYALLAFDQGLRPPTKHQLATASNERRKAEALKAAQKVQRDAELKAAQRAEMKAGSVFRHPTNVFPLKDGQRRKAS